MNIKNILHTSLQNLYTINGVRALFMVVVMMHEVSLFSTHYINKTGRSLIITNVSEQKRQTKHGKTKKRNFLNWNTRKYKNVDYKNSLEVNEVVVQALQSDGQYTNFVMKEPVLQKVYMLSLEDGQEGDLDNEQDDEITITSPGMSDKRKLFPTNNSFNYVITLNSYSNKFEKFDINHAE